MNTQKRPQHISAALVALALTALACNPTPGEGLFTADSFVYGKCQERDILPWEPGFFTVEQFDNTTTIRLQDVGGAITAQVDGIFIQFDDAYVKNNIGKELFLGFPDQSGKVRARATMAFFRTCPNAEVIPEMLGTIRFSQYELFREGQISAIIEAPTIIDARTGDILGSGLYGEFDFLIQHGRPYTNFTGPGNQ